MAGNYSTEKEMHEGNGGRPDLFGSTIDLGGKMMVEGLQDVISPWDGPKYLQKLGNIVGQGVKVVQEYLNLLEGEPKKFFEYVKNIHTHNKGRATSFAIKQLGKLKDEDRASPEEYIKAIDKWMKDTGKPIKDLMESSEGFLEAQLYTFKEGLYKD